MYDNYDSFIEKVKFLLIGFVISFMAGMLLITPIELILFAIKLNRTISRGDAMLPLLFLIGLPTGISGLISWNKGLKFMKTWILTSIIFGLPYAFMTLYYTATEWNNPAVPDKFNLLLRMLVATIVYTICIIAQSAGATAIHLAIRKPMLKIFPTVKNIE